MAKKGPHGPRYDRQQTRAKIQQASGIGIKDPEMISRLKLVERHFYQCKAAERGLPPRKLAVLDEMIASRAGRPQQSPLPQQIPMNYETEIPANTSVHCLFDLRLLEMNEDVWMVEVRPKNTTQRQSSS